MKKALVGLLGAFVLVGGVLGIGAAWFHSASDVETVHASPPASASAEVGWVWLPLDDDLVNVRRVRTDFIVFAQAGDGWMQVYYADGTRQNLRNSDLSDVQASLVAEGLGKLQGAQACTVSRGNTYFIRPEIVVDFVYYHAPPDFTLVRDANIPGCTSGTIVNGANNRITRINLTSEFAAGIYPRDYIMVGTFSGPVADQLGYDATW